MFSSSHLTEVYGGNVIRTLEQLANSASVVQGNESYLVQIASQEELCVKSKNDKYQCPCDKIKKLGICEHVLAVVKYKGPICISKYIIGISHNRPSTTSILSNKISGKKSLT